MSDARTHQAYEEHAPQLADSYDAARDSYAARLAALLPKPGRVLDVGAGTGIAAAALMKAQHEVYAVEPSAAMRKEALARFPELARRLRAGALPRALPSAEELGGAFDTVLCDAVLQHLPRGDLLEAIVGLRRLLRPGGRAVVSVPTQRGDLDAEGRDPLARFYNRITPEELTLLFERAGFVALSESEQEDGLGRAGTRWAVLVFQTAPGSGPRALERLETVIRQDSRSASYKLALLRAFADIATTRARLVTWRTDGSVALPISLIVDCWLTYYWPLLAKGMSGSSEDRAALFVPQSGGEAAAGRSRLAFAAELARLQDLFPGPLAHFLSAQRRQELPPDAARALALLRSKLRATILKGPVTYAGRSTAEDGSPLFSYDRASQSVLVPTALWREISLMSHWIVDSLVLRWAEYSRQLAQGHAGEVHAARVFERALVLLLEPPAHERDTAEAQRIYRASPTLACAWTGRALTGQRFHVDHAIPFALWHNNELWNLLPASEAANSQKSDALPSHRLLRARQDAILGCWDTLERAAPARFESELRQLCGGTPDLRHGFEALVEAIEVTARQRGCRRWEG